MNRLLASATATLAVLALATFRAPESPPPPEPRPPVALVGHDPDDVKPLPAYLDESLEWLAAAQFENGGWGAGLHARQGVDDPHAVQIDPATTAFAAMALLRVGSTPDDGPYARNVARALDYLVELVEDTPEEGPRITAIDGTQPQVKLGRNIDAAMVGQFFTAVLPHLDGRAARRTGAALDKCLRKLQRGQADDGSWDDGGWAPVLQSAMANSALESAARLGRDVDEEALRRSREYQQGNVRVRPGAAPAEVDASAGAGVALYAATSSQRATAQEAREAMDAVKAMDGEAAVSVEALREAGRSKAEAERLYDAYRRNEATTELLDDDRVWQGFGNNGGEEFLSYMMTSESLVIAGGPAWDRWHARLANLFGSIQNGNGSWSGHHCITSPVFCTAAVILALTADRDRALLTQQLER